MNESEKKLTELFKQGVRDALKESLSDVDRKRIVKDALHEWLDHKFAELGKWSLRSLAAISLAVIAYYFLVIKGWTPPK